MQARQMLLEGETVPTDSKQAARLIALLTQAEGVKFNPELLSEHGQKFISDFRGLNRIRGKSISDKRNSIDEMKVEFSEDDKENECDSAKYTNVLHSYVEHMIYLNDTIEDNFLLTIAREHQKIQAMTQSSAKYWLLEEFSTLQHFGEEIFHGTLVSESECKSNHVRGEKIQIGVNPQGLNICKLESDQTFSIPFGAVESAKSLRRCFHLCYLNENFNDSNMVIKFTSHRIAGTLYRALTEKHSFYSCETVHKNVETQFIRDLKVS
jgi:E3 ubiquitin-protein ligase MYLIP